MTPLNVRATNMLPMVSTLCTERAGLRHLLREEGRLSTHILPVLRDHLCLWLSYGSVALISHKGGEFYFNGKLSTLEKALTVISQNWGPNLYTLAPVIKVAWEAVAAAQTAEEHLKNAMLLKHWAVKKQSKVIVRSNLIFCGPPPTLTAEQEVFRTLASTYDWRAACEL